MLPDLLLQPTVGLVGGCITQFVEGHWPGEIGVGVALTEAAFDNVEPYLRHACPDWTDEHRYGVFELQLPARRSLAKLLRSEADRLRQVGNDPGGTINLFNQLAEWLESHFDEMPVSVLGV